MIPALTLQLGRGRSCASTEKVKVRQGPQVFRTALTSLLAFSRLWRPVGSNEGDLNVTQQDEKDSSPSESDGIGQRRCGNVSLGWMQAW